MTAKPQYKVVADANNKWGIWDTAHNSFAGVEGYRWLDKDEAERRTEELNSPSEEEGHTAMTTRYVLIDMSGNAIERETHEEAMQFIADNPLVWLMLWKQIGEGVNWETVERSTHNKLTTRGACTTVSTSPTARY